MASSKLLWSFCCLFAFIKNTSWLCWLCHAFFVPWLGSLSCIAFSGYLLCAKVLFKQFFVIIFCLYILHPYPHTHLIHPLYNKYCTWAACRHLCNPDYLVRPQGSTSILNQCVITKYYPKLRVSKIHSFELLYCALTYIHIYTYIYRLPLSTQVSVWIGYLSRTASLSVLVLLQLQLQLQFTLRMHIPRRIVQHILCNA